MGSDRVKRGPSANIVIYDEVAFFENTGKLYDKYFLSRWRPGSCTCSTNPIDYEGPEEDCPEHGREEYRVSAPAEPEVPQEVLFAEGDLPSYRISLLSCHDITLFEMPLDAAQLQFLNILRDKAWDAHKHEDGGPNECSPTIAIHQRIRSGDLDDNDNFRLC